MKHEHKDKYTQMTTEPVHKLIGSLAVPTIISMLVTSLYVMIDTYFVGKINTQATAAVGISFSVMAIIQAFGFFFGHGSGNFISRRLGARDYESAEKMAATGFFSAFIAGCLITAFGLIYLTPICIRLGSTPTILPYTETYLGIILLGAPFMASSLVLNNQMRFQGNALYAMVGITAGTILNIGLAPLLIFVFDMGIAGAAWATLCGQVCSFFILLYMDSRGENIRIRPRNFTPRLAYFREILYGGSPSLCRQGLASLAAILLNVAAGRYGDAAIAGMSIVGRICMFINSFLIGFGQGFQPVCGYNYGAGIYSRVREGFWFCVKVGVVFLTLCSIIGYIYAPEIVSWFREDDAECCIARLRTPRVVLHPCHTAAPLLLRSARRRDEPGSSRLLFVPFRPACSHPRASFAAERSGYISYEGLLLYQLNVTNIRVMEVANALPIQNSNRNRIKQTFIPLCV